VKCFKDNQGQSLVEVVVAVGAMSLLLVALLSLVVVSIKNSRLAKDRAKAVALAQGGIELMRAYRDYSWTEFSSFATGDDYVLDASWTVDLIGLGEVATGCDEASYMDATNFYSRCVGLSSAGGASAVDVQVTVSWQEGSQLQQTVQNTRLSVWER
jgi:Tfp pilus assembly protein PilV